MVDMGLAEAAALGSKIDAMEFDHVFVMDGSVLGFRSVDAPNVYAPTVTNDPEGDIHIDSPGWEAITGMTGQHGYNGAVFHSSEYIGAAIAREMSRLSEDEPMTFVVVPVGTDTSETPEIVGWAILYRENTVPEFTCLYPND